ncbi:MBL fold metallo-hydrolase [Haloimpatiens lingqiaonensis]|uniref:MBL fold metallo-hydrolase n=1 Tax=Haloimpatiens lingqiaonensis TaxID=1380675 RepID=UPI0010FEC752|nr:MBL fold metallo-hydrolase [Haloimpatiens lingqiaonensis]
MNISFLGGAGEVGASSILLRVCNKNILLDCGIRQSASKDPLPDFRTIQEKGGVDAIVISHAHMDHIGSLPIISNEYPNARIYMNNMTKDLTRVLLYDSLKIMNSRESEIPLYAENHVEDMLDRIFTINYGVEFEMFEDIKIVFYNAGHIAGASCVYIKTPEGALFYSGDFSLFSQNTVEGAKFPKLRPDVAILECTYGDKLHSNRQVEEKRLVDLAKECIGNKGKMLIPSFALGRAQEIILMLKKAMNKGEIQKAKIYVDGMVKNINAVYKRNPLYLRNSLGKKILRGTEPFYDDNIIAVDNKEIREGILNSSEASIIIASSGMLTGGWSPVYAEKICSMENGYIVISGYQDEESPGRRLLNLLSEQEEKELEINGKILPVKCHIEKVGLSAHGDKSEIKGVVERLQPKELFLVHGEREIIGNFAKELMQESRGRIYTPESGETYNIDIKNKRKQLQRAPLKAMKNHEVLGEDNIKELWEYVREIYQDRLFTVEELYYIWTGKKAFMEDKIVNVQKLILNSPYFEPDERRLFLFKAESLDNVEKSLKKEGLKPNEISQLIQERFGKFNYKKAGLIMDKKKVVLYFNFPNTVSKDIYQLIEDFKEEFSWDITIGDSVNTNAVEFLLKNLFESSYIKKISYKLDEHKVILDLYNESLFMQKYSERDIENKIDEFNKNTGMKLEMKTGFNGSKDKLEMEDIIKTSNKNEMEQNAAIKYLDDSFMDEEFRPYKKSIKNISNQRYMELVFITPMVGQRYLDKLKDISENIGWNIKISTSCNQNEIITIALKLCNERGILLKKNPAFSPFNLSVTLKPQEAIDLEVFEEIKKIFEHKTGCEIH